MSALLYIYFFLKNFYYNKCRGQTPVSRALWTVYLLSSLTRATRLSLQDNKQNLYFQRGVFSYTMKVEWIH